MVKIWRLKDEIRVTDDGVQEMYAGDEKFELLFHGRVFLVEIEDNIAVIKLREMRNE